MNKQWLPKIIAWLSVLLLLFTLFKHFEGRDTVAATAVDYSDFVAEVNNHKIKRATIQEGAGRSAEITAVTIDDKNIKTLVS